MGWDGMKWHERVLTGHGVMGSRDMNMNVNGNAWGLAMFSTAGGGGGGGVGGGFVVVCVD
jgi:hypothetical protein